MSTVAKKIFPAGDVVKLRDSLGWSQEQLAEHLDVSRSLVALWETGRRIPSGPVAKDLAQLQAEQMMEEKSAISA
jgi:DNA-binding transcriptional regulator YiaG